MRLKWKFLIAIMAVVTLFGGIHILLIKLILQTTLQDELRYQLETIASSTARSLIPFLLVDDLVGMNKLLLKTQEADERIGYAFILDRDAAPVVHTFSVDGVPDTLLTANPLAADSDEPFRRVQNKHRPSKTFLDIAYPLGEKGRYGTLRMGLDEGGIRATLNRIVVIFMGMVVIFALLGVLGALVASRWINRPMGEIEAAIDIFDLQEPVPNIEVRSGDELEYFADHIEAMMTRLKKTHERLEEARTKMFKAERIATIGSLASGIAHEVRNPLAGMLNCLEGISKDPEGEKNFPIVLPLLMEAANRINATITRFLNFARVPTQRGGSASVNSAVESAVALAKPRLSGSGVRLEVDLDGDLPAVPGEEHLFQQVALNILINAIDAVGGSGVVSVKTTFDEAAVILEIRDNGVGIEEKDIRSLFDPFYSTKGSEGTGLGLAVSMEIIKRFHGTILVESRKGEGATFRVKIPVDDGRPPAAGPAGAPEASPLPLRG